MIFFECFLTGGCLKHSYFYQGVAWIFSSAGRTRTADLKIMSLTRYQLLHRAMYFFSSEGWIRTTDLKGYEPCELTTALPRNIFLNAFTRGLPEHSFVTSMGLEPIRLSTHAPQTCLSTISNTRPFGFCCAPRGTRTLTSIGHHPLKMARLPIPPSARFQRTFFLQR